MEDSTLRIGVALHSLRAVPEDAMQAVLDSGLVDAAPIHIHVAEQIGEVQDCLALRNARPVEWLLDHAPVDPRWCLVHATHMTADETRRVAESAAVAGLCPTTEANLGDGFLPVERVRTRGLGVCIGSDSNVRIDPLEELRELEGIARRQSGRRNVISTETLLCFGADEGAGALGLEEWADVEVDLRHRSLHGVDDVFEGLIAGCGADVFLQR
jgi:formimidoylglutamate deiminase